MVGDMLEAYLTFVQNPRDKMNKTATCYGIVRSLGLAHRLYKLTHPCLGCGDGQQIGSLVSQDL